jgi:hypothetical protein
MSQIDIVRSIVIEGSPERVFPYVLTVDLPLIFKRTGLIPAISGSEGSRSWDRSGLRRTVRFEDGSSAKEELTLVDAPKAFAYRIQDFTSILGRLVDHIQGDWALSAMSPTNTAIRWRYSLFPKNRAVALVARILIAPMIARMMAKALGILKRNFPQYAGRGKG